MAQRRMSDELTMSRDEIGELGLSCCGHDTADGD
jgi:hypothetical protein